MKLSDKTKHVLACVLITFILNIFGYHQHLHPGIVLSCSAAIALLIGSLKELYDEVSKGTGSWDDFKADAWGIAIGTLISIFYIGTNGFTKSLNEF